MTFFSEKVLIFNRYIRGLMPNLIKQSWTDSSVEHLSQRKALKIGCLFLLFVKLFMKSVVALVWLWVLGHSGFTLLHPSPTAL